MSAKTEIEWTDSTWNPIRGCSRVSEGCRNCYAERMAARFAGPGEPFEGLAGMTPQGPRWTGKVRRVEEALDLPLRWRKPRRIFVNSVSDLFHEAVPDEWIDRIFAVMSDAQKHTFQVLTKRPERMFRYINAESGLRVSKLLMDKDGCFTFPGRNVHLGVSVEDQATADERIPLLLQTPAAVRWVSYEPALGPVDLHHACFNGADSFHKMEGLHWIVVGGESGPWARPFDIGWARAVIAQCREAGVPCFVKQVGYRPIETAGYGASWNPPLRDKKGGTMSEWPADLRVRQMP